MRIVSWTVRGLGGASRRLAVKELQRRQKVQIALLQETKLKKVSDSIIKEVWGSRFINWVVVDAKGSSGGLLMLWDSRSVSIIKSGKDVFFCFTCGGRLGQQIEVVDYFGLWPKRETKKTGFLERVKRLLGGNGGAWCTLEYYSIP